jgi:RNA polymerase sigma-70 factor, ECF subfamily
MGFRKTCAIWHQCVDHLFCSPRFLTPSLVSGNKLGGGGVANDRRASKVRRELALASTLWNWYREIAMDTLRFLELTVDHAAQATEEATLVRELTAGSEEAFGYLLGVYQNPVFNLVSHIVDNRADAADVLQEVFLKVCRGIRHFHGESSLRTWIYKIAVHEASNHRRGWLRRLRHEPFSLEDSKGEPVRYSAPSPAETPYEALAQAERQELVTRALASLAQPYRTVVMLREIEGLSYEEIAHVLGVAEGTVKSRLLRGREMLRRKLAGLLGK